MIAGDKIKWSYRHFLNRKSSLMRTKYGIYIRLVKHPTPPTKIWPQCAVVQFDGNKRVSRIPCCELELIEDKEND